MKIRKCDAGLFVLRKDPIPNIFLGISNPTLKKQRKIGKDRRKWLYENSQNYTRQEAADILGMTLQYLTSYASKYGYHFKTNKNDMVHAREVRSKKNTEKRKKHHEWVLKNHSKYTLYEAMRASGLGEVFLRNCAKDLGVSFQYSEMHKNRLKGKS